MQNSLYRRGGKHHRKYRNWVFPIKPCSDLSFVDLIEFIDYLQKKDEEANKEIDK